MTDVAIIAPVRPTQADALQLLLRRLPPRVFTGRIPPTHFARFVVLPLDELPHLLFSSRFDGPVDGYLRALAKTPEAQAIWGFCGWRPARDLPSFLGDHRLHVSAQYIVSAFPAGATVSDLNSALRLRSELASFAARADSMDAMTLVHDLRQLRSVRAITAP